MKYSRRTQVLFTDKQYKTLETIAEKQRKKLSTLIREAVVDIYLKEEKKKRMEDAIDSLLNLAKKPSSPPPGDWESWEKEYAKIKAGHKK